MEGKRFFSCGRQTRLTRRSSLLNSKPKSKSSYIGRFGRRLSLAKYPGLGGYLCTLVASREARIMPWTTAMRAFLFKDIWLLYSFWNICLKLCYTVFSLLEPRNFEKRTAHATAGYNLRYTISWYKRWDLNSIKLIEPFGYKRNTLTLGRRNLLRSRFYLKTFSTKAAT